MLKSNKSTYLVVPGPIIIVLAQKKGKDKEDYINNTYKAWAPKRKPIACII